MRPTINTRLEQLSRTDMAMLERALRNGWDTPDDVLAQKLKRVQAVLDDPDSLQRSRERAQRIMELAAGRSATGKEK